MKPQWDPREILRYPGADHATPLIQELMERAQRETEEVSRPKSVFLPLPIQVEEDRVFLGEKAFASKSLASHLRGCREGYLFAFTLGREIDMRLKRYAVTDLPYVPVLQACAASYTELCADLSQEELRESARRRGLYLRPRYSPGYGDFSLQAQTFFFEALQIPKRLGVSLTEGYLMVPTKSITGVIGLTSDPTQCHVGRCMSCDAQNCPFREKECSPHE